MNQTTDDRAQAQPYIILVGQGHRTLIPLREVKLVRETPGRVTIDLVSGGNVGIDGGDDVARLLDMVADQLSNEAGPS